MDDFIFFLQKSAISISISVYGANKIINENKSDTNVNFNEKFKHLKQ